MAAAAATVELDQTTQGRLSRMDAMQQQAMAAGLAERLRTDIRKTEAALDRVAAGSYGECCRCGAEIPAARLAADPAAPFCADCVKGWFLAPGCERQTAVLKSGAAIGAINPWRLPPKSSTRCDANPATCGSPNSRRFARRISGSRAKVIPARHQPRHLQDALGRRSADQHPGRQGQGQGVSGKAGAACNRQTGGTAQ